MSITLFLLTRSTRSRAKKAYRKFLDLDRDRGHQRWSIPDRSALTLYWGEDTAIILNVSNCGFAIETSRYLARGVVIEQRLGRLKI